MAWDEMRFGREYDVGQFNIVGTKDFTMGAMEVSEWRCWRCPPRPC
jgi:aminopeptidase N